MQNELIRKTAKQNKVMLWEIAERQGIAESTFIRRLRRELPQQEREKILEIIKDLATEKAGEG